MDTQPDERERVFSNEKKNTSVHRTGQFPRQSQMCRVLWGSGFATKALFVDWPILQTRYIKSVRKRHQLQ